MARKTAECLITEEGRDKGKTFVLTEMPALQAEDWGRQVIMALARGQVDIGDINEVGAGGMHQVALLGFGALAKISIDEARPLLAAMLECVTVKTDSGIIRALMPETDIEEVATILKLRMEVFNLHTGFLKGGGPLKPQTSTTAPASSNTETSPQPSVQFSRTARTKRPR